MDVITGLKIGRERHAYVSRTAYGRLIAHPE